MSILRHGSHLALVAAALGLAACRPAGPSAHTGSNLAETVTSTTNRAPRIYQVKGVVQEVQPGNRKIKITHEAIPGYMEAMTMMFDVRKADELNGLEPGDAVSFRMLVTADDGWIEALTRLNEPRTPVPADPPGLRRVREVEPLAVGDLMPDYRFTNALGRPLRLADFKGQALAITFIFTRCPFPTFCPRLTGSFAEVQRSLQTLSNAPTNWHLLSITIDPDYDTPSRLKAYAASYHADPARWDFVTGELIDITAIGEQFGLQFWRPKPTDPISHNVRTLVIDAAGKVQWITVENEWKPATLVEQMIKAAQTRP